MKIRLLLLCALFASSSQLHAQSIMATTAQTNTQQQVSPVNPAELTATFWDFTGQGALPSIGFISITLTLIDGDTAMGEFDFDHLFLALDGVNTGLALNGFRGGGLEDTLTISGNIDMAISDALLAEFADMQFVGTIVSDNMASILQPNDLFVGNDTMNATTTLTLAVPEPTTWTLVAMGLALAGAAQARRLRRWI